MFSSSIARFALRKIVKTTLILFFLFEGIAKDVIAAHGLSEWYIDFQRQALFVPFEKYYVGIGKIESSESDASRAVDPVARISKFDNAASFDESYEPDYFLERSGVEEKREIIVERNEQYHHDHIRLAWDQNFCSTKQFADTLGYYL